MTDSNLAPHSLLNQAALHARLILLGGFTVVPIVAGLAKFFHRDFGLLLAALGHLSHRLE